MVGFLVIDLSLVNYMDSFIVFVSGVNLFVSVVIMDNYMHLPRLRY